MEDDEPVGFIVVRRSDLPGPFDETNWSYIPERIWERLLGIGQGYHLHFAQFVEPIIDTVLNSDQCSSFATELTFVESISCDEALLECLRRIKEKALVASRDQLLCLVLSPP